MTTQSSITQVVHWQSLVRKNERLTPCNEPYAQVSPEEIGSHRIPIGSGYAVISVFKRCCNNSAARKPILATQWFSGVHFAWSKLIGFHTFCSGASEHASAFCSIWIVQCSILNWS